MVAPLLYIFTVIYLLSRKKKEINIIETYESLENIYVETATKTSLKQQHLILSYALHRGH